MVKEYRNLRNLSLREFARVADISHTYVDSIERGIDFQSKKKPRVSNEVIHKLGKAMGIDSAELYRISIADLEDVVYEGKENLIPGHDLKDFTEYEIKEVQEFIEFMRFKREMRKRQDLDR